MKYKRVEAANGRVMFFINGHLKKESDFPASVLNQLEGTMELEIGVNEEPAETKPNEPLIRREDRKCFIDGNPGQFKKFLELQTVYLCDEHQHSLTTGEVVYEMRKAGLLA